MLSDAENKSKPLSTSNEKHEENNHGNFNSSISSTSQKKAAGGWKTMPYILGNETFERLASFGMLANFMVYLRREYHMSQVSATNVINIWSGVTNFAPLFGAFISDAYVGRFLTIAFASLASLLGMMTMTLTAWLPQLHPPPCALQQSSLGQCIGPAKAQLVVLLAGLGLLSIGSGGIRPCSIPFGVDQFDPTTDEGQKGIKSYFNWYYTSLTLVLLLIVTVMVYIQDSVSWVLGFGIPCVLTIFSMILFLIGRRVYNHVKPEGSIFSGLAQVAVAAYKKRKLSDAELVGSTFYDPQLKGGSVVLKLPLTNQFRFLNKAVIVLEDDINPDGTRVNKWNLSSIQQVEELKCLIRIIPIWASGILSLISITQQSTFTVSQALQMDRHLGPNFQIPAGSISVISFTTIALWLPFYDRFVVPSLRKLTHHEGGITLLQRIGIGNIFSVLSMVVAALIERARRNSANLSPGHNPFGVAPISVLWLSPQLILMGFCETFNIIGQIEFFNTEIPEHMRSIGNALFSCSYACASYFSSLMVVVVHKTSGRHGRDDWLTDDLNNGRLDWFYFVIAGIGALNFIYFLLCANMYCYKGSGKAGDDKRCLDVEMSVTIS